jgi:adhesin transport system outer membrane protein
MPIYQGGLTARRNAAGHAVEAAQSTIQRTRLEVRQKLLESRSQVMSLLSTLQIQSRQEALSIRTRELYQQQYLDLALTSTSRRPERRTGSLSGAIHATANRRADPPASAQLSV